MIRLKVDTKGFSEGELINAAWWLDAVEDLLDSTRLRTQSHLVIQNLILYGTSHICANDLLEEF